MPPPPSSLVQTAGRPFPSLQVLFLLSPGIDSDDTQHFLLPGAVRQRLPLICRKASKGLNVPEAEREPSGLFCSLGLL